jgi:P-type E1-E2 ATPase
MTFMIVASPCAVVLATMAPLLAAIANAGRHGVLVKSAMVMEQLGATTRVAFDKTATLTCGTPELADIRALPAAGVTEDQLLRLAAATEYPSEHPLAAAIVHAARRRDLDLPAADEFTAHPSQSVSALAEDHFIQLSSPAILATFAQEASETATAALAALALHHRGHTAVVVLCDTHPVGVLGITDQLRPEAAPTVAALTRLTGAAPVLLTGDNPTSATQLAGPLAITDVRAGLLPKDKVAAVRDLEALGQRVRVLADGITHAPALAAAHTAIAMGGAGSDLALHAADAVVVRDDLATIPAAIALSRRARRVVTTNLIIAGGFIAGLVAWDLIATLPLPLGVAGHEGSIVIVGLNGLRLLRTAAWNRATHQSHKP